MRIHVSGRSYFGLILMAVPGGGLFSLFCSSRRRRFWRPQVYHACPLYVGFESWRCGEKKYVRVGVERRHRVVNTMASEVEGVYLVYRK